MGLEAWNALSPEEKQAQKQQYNEDPTIRAQRAAKRERQVAGDRLVLKRMGIDPSLAGVSIASTQWVK